MARILLALLCLSLSFLTSQAQTIDLITPNGGEVWEGCTTQTITWVDSGTSDFYSIDYSVDNGASWTSIATFYNTTIGEYEWTVPNLQSTQVLIRVQDSNNALIEDISASNFSITAPLLLLSPNGGEVWEGGTTQQITWVYSGTSNYFNLDYSLDAGNTWLSIEQSTYNTTGIYNWTVPNSPSTSALVRVTDYYESCQSDKSDFTFEISPATPVINVTYPYSGLTMYVGRTISLQWNSQFVVSNQVQIEYTTNGGSTWGLIATITENDGSYTWTVPNEVSNEVQIRITDLTNNQTFGLSSAYSSIALPFINITSPAGGATLAQCEQVTISWTSGGTVNNRYQVQWSDNGGTNWNTVVSNYSSTSYNWNYPSAVGNNIQLRVRDHNDYDNFDIVSPDLIFTPNTDIIVLSPNGGESWEAGTQQTITWAAAGSVDYVEVYYSIDNGSSWTYLDFIYAPTGSFSWTIPDSPSNQCLVQVRDPYNGSCREDFSDALFTIAPPTPVITNVNPGFGANGVIYADRNVNVTWNSAFLSSPFVAIDFSTDGGSTYTNLISATEDDGSWTWTASNDLSENCVFRVREVGSSVEGISQNIFALRQPYIEVTAPTGGTTLAQCEQVTISWTSGGTVNNRYQVQWSDNGGTNWNTVVSNYSSTSYNWNYPSAVGNNIQLRVRDHNDYDNFDIVSPDLIFTPNTDIIVLSPNGGESWEAGTQQTITWAAAGSVDYVEVYYSIDNGSSWTYLDFIYAPTGSFSWTIPDSPSNQCLVQVRDPYNGSCREDFSDALFTIAPPTPVITNVNPGFGANGVIYADRNVNVTWNSAFLSSPFVAIDFSTDGGSTYTNLISATEDDGSWTWTASNDLSENCVFRVSEVGSSVEGISQNIFALRQPYIEVTAPTGGTTLAQCEQVTISWTSGGTVNNRYQVQWSDNGGTNWNTVVSNYSSTSYNWNYPSAVGNNIQLRVRDHNDYDNFDIVSPDLIFTPNTDIILINPNGGESLDAGTNYTIQWASAAVVDYVELYYSIDNGSTWTYIDFVYAPSSSTTWTVPNSPSDQCLIRIEDPYNGSCREDYSDATFSIVTPAPTVYSPNGGETYYSGQGVNISWSDEFYSSSFVAIEYSPDNGVTWEFVSEAENNDGSYTWTIPEEYTLEGLIRITDFADVTQTDTSDAVFEIGPSIVVTSPNGDNGIQDWRVCTETTITWTSGGTSNYFRLYYSLNNGNTWIALNTNYYSPGFLNTYDWVMPNSPTATALVRVEDRFNSNQVDESDATFTIAPAITVLAPNGGEVLGVGQTITISWLNEGATNYYNIDYSTNGGATWNSIVFNEFIPSSQYQWTVPGPVGSEYRIRVTDNIDNCKTDVSDAYFEVSSVQQGTIVLNAPNGNENWEACSQHIISWNNIATSDFFDLAYSLDNGGSWISIVSNYFSTDGTYAWTLPNVNTTSMLVRVQDHYSPLFTDDSNSVFTVIGPEANAGVDLTLCSGEDALLQATGGVNYSWSPAMGLSDSNIANPIVSTTMTTLYTVTVTDANGCVAADDVLVSIDNGLCDIEGCMDTDAYNYNPLATIDNGFCLYTEGGGGTCATDIDGDGIISTSDLLLVLGSFGSTCE